MTLTRKLARLAAAWLAPTVLLAGLVVAGTTTPAAAAAGCEAQQPSPSCSLFAGVGSNFGSSSSPTLGTSAANTDVTNAAGGSITLGASYEDANTAYGAPAACQNQTIAQGTMLANGTAIITCGYWVLEEASNPTATQPAGRISTSDIVDDYVNNATPGATGAFAWYQPQNTQSASYPCYAGTATCSDAAAEWTGTGLCNRVAIQGTQTTTWCSNTGVYEPDGATLANSSFGSYDSFSNPSWTQPYENQAAGCAGNCTLRLQIDGNLVIYSGSTPVWSSDTTSFAIPVTSTSGSQYSGSAPVSGAADPGAYDTLTWFYATGSSAATCQSNLATFLGESATSRTTSPAGCQTQSAVVASTSNTVTYNNLTTSVASSGAFFARPVVFEWTAVGGYQGGGASYRILLAAGPAESTNASAPPPPNTTDGLSCYGPNSTQWSTSCSAPVGTAIDVTSSFSPFPKSIAANPSSPPGTATSTSTTTSYPGTSGTPNNPPYPPGTSTSATSGNISLSISSTYEPVGTDITATASASSLDGACGIGISFNGTTLGASPSTSFSTSYTSSTAIQATFWAFYIWTCGDNYYTSGSRAGLAAAIYTPGAPGTPGTSSTLSLSLSPSNYQPVGSDITVSASVNTLPPGACGIGISFNGQTLTAGSYSASTSYTHSTAIQATFRAYYVWTCGVNYYTTGTEIGLAAAIYTPAATSAGTGFNGSPAGSWEYVRSTGTASVNNGDYGNQAILCIASGSGTCGPYQITNSTPGTYTLNAFYIWKGGDNYWTSGPNPQITLTFTGGGSGSGGGGTTNTCPSGETGTPPNCVAPPSGPSATCSVAAGQGPNVQTDATNCTYYVGTNPLINLSYSGTMSSSYILGLGEGGSQAYTYADTCPTIGEPSCSFTDTVFSTHDTTPFGLVMEAFAYNSNSNFAVAANGNYVDLTWVAKPQPVAPVNYPT